MEDFRKIYSASLGAKLQEQHAEMPEPAKPLGEGSCEHVLVQGQNLSSSKVFVDVGWARTLLHGIGIGLM